MQSNETCPLVDYLVVMKGRSDNTIKEYRTDLFMFFNYICNCRRTPIIGKSYDIIDPISSNRFH